MRGVRFDAEARGMNIRPGAGQQNPVDNIQERADIGDLRRAGEHQRQGAGYLGDRAEITLPSHLSRETTFHLMRGRDHADHWLGHRNPPIKAP